MAPKKGKGKKKDSDDKDGGDRDVDKDQQLKDEYLIWSCRFFIKILIFINFAMCLF